jgi:hypothetical protein
MTNAGAIQFKRYSETHICLPQCFILNQLMSFVSAHFPMIFCCTLFGCRVTSVAKLLEKTDWSYFVSFLVLFFVLDQRSAEIKSKILHDIMMC